MLPQGESSGLAIEDAILFTHILSKRAYLPNKPAPENPLSIPSLITHYTTLRKPKIEDAFQEANFRWENHGGSTWFAHNMKELLTPWFLWWKRAQWEAGFSLEADVRKIDV